MENLIGATFGGVVGILIICLIGALVGWLASIVMKTNAQMGAFANILVGVVGAMLGGWIASLFGVVESGLLVGILIAIAGACALIAILKAVNILK